MLGQETIKGKYWSLMLKNEYKISDEHLPQKNSSHSSIPNPTLPLEIVCWNDKKDLSFFTQHCFGHYLGKNYNSLYYSGYILEVDIKLSKNLPGQNISSFVTFPLTNFGSYAHYWTGSVDNNFKMYYGIRYGIYYQLTYNKNTGSYLFNEYYVTKSHGSNWRGAFRYNDSTGHLDFWFEDRQSDIYKKRETTSCTSFVCQNMGYIGQLGYIEPKTDGNVEISQLKVSFLAMENTRITAKQSQGSNGTQYKSCSCAYTNQPSSTSYDGYFYWGYGSYANHMTMSTDRYIAHIHLPTNSVYIMTLDRINSSNCGTPMYGQIMSKSLGSNSKRNLDLPSDLHPYAERRFWDLNDDNIIVCRNSNGISVLNLGRTEDLQANRWLKPSTIKLYDAAGRTIDSVWRCARFSRDFNVVGERQSSNSYSDFQIRINDHNNIVTLSNKHLIVTSYNAPSNKFENSEMFDLGSNVNFYYRSCAINNNNEIVIVDLWNGRIYVYELVNKYNFHTYSFSSYTRAIMKEDATLQNPATIEEAISVEVKHRTAIEQCEIVISPRELDDPNLIPLDGRILLKSNEPYLYSIFGDNYRTNDVDLNSFKLPDLRGRYPIGRGQDSRYEGINAQIQSFSLESLNDFGFNPINNQIKKYYKSASAKAEVNLTNTQAVKSVTLTNTNEINTTRKSVSIDDKCYMFYIRKIK